MTGKHEVHDHERRFLARVHGMFQEAVRLGWKSPFMVTVRDPNNDAKLFEASCLEADGLIALERPWPEAEKYHSIEIAFRSEDDGQSVEQIFDLNIDPEMGENVNKSEPEARGKTVTA